MYIYTYLSGGLLNPPIIELCIELFIGIESSTESHVHNRSGNKDPRQKTTFLPHFLTIKCG